MRLSEHIYRTISTVAGPLLFVKNVFSARIGEVVTVHTPDNRYMDAEVLEIDGDTVLVEVYGGTQGLDIERTTVSFTDAIKKVPLSADIVGRIFNGSFEPKDGAPMFIPEKWTPITGAPINPSARARPEDFIETGFSPIDGLNTLVRGQKLPVGVLILTAYEDDPFVVAAVQAGADGYVLKNAEAEQIAAAPAVRGELRGVAAERHDLVAHPLERHHLVADPVGPRAREGRVEVAQVEEAERPEPVAPGTRARPGGRSGGCPAGPRCGACR